MVLLDENIITDKGILYRGAVKILRKEGSRYVIKKDGLTAYASTNILRFMKEMK